MSLRSEMKRLLRAGFNEKAVALPDGTILNYGEGPSNGKTPLLLLHGQTGAWQDYAPVLVRLSDDYHVFAVDCHGHGKSSQNPAKYQAKEMGRDFIWFIERVMGAPAVVSGHSSGGLLTAWLAANAPQDVCGVVLEDPPFFSTVPGGRWESSFAYVDTYEPMHRFLNQSEEKDWVIYYLEHCAWGKFVGEKGMNWMVKSARRYRARHPGRPLHYAFLPQSVNQMFTFLDDYDLRFGEAFYNSSWFEDYHQEETLRRIRCPAVLIHTKWSVDENGILMAAMSGEDAEHAARLIPGCRTFDIASGHDSHVEKPEEFLRAFYLLQEEMAKAAEQTAK